MIAILSDTHDDVAMLKSALRVLGALRPERYLHCGDVVEPGVLDEFVGLPLTFVHGNNDRPGTLRRYAELMGLEYAGAYVELIVDGKKIGMMHGDDGTLLRRLLERQELDYLLHGHTHVKRDERVGKTRVINPGALYRARVKSVATLDVENDALRFLVIDGARA